MSKSIEIAKLSTLSSSESQKFGACLARTLYPPSTKFLLLCGDLGAGKTTLLKGLAEGLGLTATVQSPTYAVERDYPSLDSGQAGLLHLDLFRVRASEARILLLRAREYPGFVAIEWGDRLRGTPLPPGRIDVTIADVTEQERRITVTFRDSAIPGNPEIVKWEQALLLPNHIRVHNRTVARVAKKLATHLLDRGTVVRRRALEAAAWSHDLFRFLNLPTGSLARFPRTARERWAKLRRRYGEHHEHACAQFLTQRGFPIVAAIVRTHGVLHSQEDPPRTTEQKLLYYADKRVIGDRVVSVDDRFDDFIQRYGGGKESPQAKQWRAETKAIEWELFPEGAPL